MMRQSQSLTRAREKLPPPLPAIIMHPRGQPCHGLAFIRRHGAALPDLANIREYIRDIRRGKIGSDDNPRELLIVIFDGVARPLGCQFPAVLPLVANGPGLLTSHSWQDNYTKPAKIDSVRAIEIWWAGQVQRVPLDMLQAIPLAALWPLPDITIHVGLHAGPHVSPHAGLPPAQSRGGRQSNNSSSPPSPTAMKIGRSLGLAALVKERRNDPFTDLRTNLKKRPSFVSLLRQNFGPGMAIPSSLDNLGRIIIYALIAWTIVTLYVKGLSIFIFISILFLIFYFFSGLLSNIIEESSPSGHTASTKPSGPGWMENFLGWMAWKNPLGSMQRQLNARLQKIESLVKQGMIDDALRLALRLGSGNGEQRKLPRRYPRQLPAARAKLDFDLPEFDYEIPVLPDAVDWEMQHTYQELAQKLENDGDYKRAAFIHSQLLGQHVKAVKLLERGEMLEEAARLALSAKIDPVLTIQLLYKTGRKDAALALAQRAGCFDQLVQQTLDKEDTEFHAYVVKAWTDMLVETGQPLRALQVTDNLVDMASPNQDLLNLRRNWLSRAVSNQEITSFPAEVIARSLLCGTMADPGQLARFPQALPQVEEPFLAHAIAALQQQILHGKGAENLLSLHHMLSRLAAPKSPEQAGFWQGTAPALLEILTGHLLHQASHLLDQHDFGRICHILDQAGHKVLAYDLGKLRKLHRAAPPPERHWHLPEPATVRPPVQIACVLGTGMILAWRNTEMLELLDNSGAIVWQQPMSEIYAMVPIGSGANALILQHEGNGQTRLTRFDTARRTLHPIGNAELLSFHDVTTELAWLVQIADKVGALSLAALCAPTPSLEFLWSCALTDRVRAVAFQHQETASSWITIDVTRERFGITEIWRFEGSGELANRVCRITASNDVPHPIPPINWAWGGTKYDFSSLTPYDVYIYEQFWNEDAEKAAREESRQRAQNERLDSFLSCDLGRSAVILPDPAASSDTSSQTIIRCPDKPELDFTLHCDPQNTLTPLARIPASTGHHKDKSQKSSGKVLLGDSFGRLLLVDPNLARIIIY